jgi:hypothetical protein
MVEPVIIKLPDIIALPVYGKDEPTEPVFTVIGNVVPLPFVNVIIFEETDAVINNEPVSVLPPFNAKEAVVANEALTACNTYDAVVTNEALTAFKTYDADVAVPCNEPVKPNVELVEPVIDKLPVILAFPVYGNDPLFTPSIA